jgi:hypothetical protein
MDNTSRKQTASGMEKQAFVAWIGHTTFDKGCSGLLSEREVDGDDGDDDNLRDVEIFSGQCNNSQSYRYSQFHTLVHVAAAADHEAVLQSTNSQWNNR